jgi:uncharacterized short protein YbdD (DUF466 family)
MTGTDATGTGIGTGMTGTGIGTEVSGTGISRAGATAAALLLRSARAVRWYVREVMGDAKYERYVRHLQAVHPDAPVPTEREFWRQHYAEQEASPGTRCC